MLDLSLSIDPTVVTKLFLVAPDDREEEVRAQINRPAFGPVADQHIRYLRYSELAEHRGVIARFGSGMHPIERLAHRLS
jgi:type II restriction enzyme